MSWDEGKAPFTVKTQHKKKKLLCHTCGSTWYDWDSISTNENSIEHYRKVCATRFTVTDSEGNSITLELDATITGIRESWLMGTPGKQAELLQPPVDTQIPQAEAKENVSTRLRARK